MTVRFIESKEVPGGYSLVEAPSINKS